MTNNSFGSLTKEPPLKTLDSAIRAVRPGMTYVALLDFARTDPKSHRDAPGLASKRFLLINKDKTLSYDHFLSLTKIHSLESLFLRKIMYFLWAYRDERIRRFICESIADFSGKWRASEVINKDNAKFFRTWLSAKAAKKARSNFEFFLVETGIYNKEAETVHLELDDGWLEQASIAAAQHEADPTVREELLANPIEFLKARNWLGLLNTDNPKPPVASPAKPSDSDPLEDDAIDATPLVKGSSYDWNRPAPAASAAAWPATFNINLVARERANASHHMLEKTLVAVAKNIGRTPKYTQNIDVYFDVEGETILAEIKSCTDGNFHSQVRKAISQLLEYRFLYKDHLKSRIQMLLLMETMPPKGKEWMVDYAASMDIVLAWKSSASDEIGTTSNIPNSLAAILTHF